ncbi:MAG: YceI family protein [Acidiferrobacter sp.]
MQCLDKPRPIHKRTAVGLAVLFLTTAMGIGSAWAAAYAVQHQDPSGVYRIDPNHSLAWFTVGHAGVAVVVGRFDTMTGVYRIDRTHPARDSVKITIPTASINTDFAMRDNDLRGPDFLNVKVFPQARFVSRRYVATSTTAGNLYGQLTLHGITRPVVLHVREIGTGPVGLPKPWGGYVSGYEATTVIHRRAFGIDAYPGMIADRIYLHFNIEGVRTQIKP